MSLVYEGRAAWIFPDHYDADQIVGVSHIKETDLDKLLPLAMAAWEEDFAGKVRGGDILVAGRNFGYGHPHFQGMAVMRKLGLWVILAESFAPGFYRSEIVTGMAFLTVPGIAQRVGRFDELSVDYPAGTVTNRTRGETIQGVPPSEMAIELAGTRSLMKFIAGQLAAQRDAGAKEE